MRVHYVSPILDPVFRPKTVYWATPAQSDMDGVEYYRFTIRGVDYERPARYFAPPPPKSVAIPTRDPVAAACALRIQGIKAKRTHYGVRVSKEAAEAARKVLK